MKPKIDHIETTKKQIVTDQTDAEAAEEKASEDHITNKETLVSTADDFKTTKTQCLEDAKSQQIKEKEDAENFESEGNELQIKADDRSWRSDVYQTILEMLLRKHCSSYFCC